MSKITPKNLSYDSTLPPFLARLQSQNANNDGRQDFHAARPKKPRDAELDKEDEPVFFDEATGETLTKSEWEEREKFGEGNGVEKAEGERGSEGNKEIEGEGGAKQENRESTKQKEKENIAGIGGARKRKAGKVVGGEEEEQDLPDEKSPSRKATHASKTDAAPQITGKEKKTEKSGKSAKKGKKIKLSFGDDE